jgi:Uma2 family endonuclease
MNVQMAIKRPEPVKLTVDNFLLLKNSGAFAAFGKTELLDGELSGVPLKDEHGNAWESDGSVPIKLRIADYHLLDEAGAFESYGKTELLDGVVFAMSPQHRPHGFVKDELAYRLRRALEAMASPLHVATEQSVVIEPHNEPEPDIILTSEPRGTGGIPVRSVALLVEVADASRRLDLEQKSSLYALAEVPEYWVVDVNRRSIHQMWRPDGEAYAERRQVAFGEQVEATTIKDLAVETGGL